MPRFAVCKIPRYIQEQYGKSKYLNCFVAYYIPSSSEEHRFCYIHVFSQNLYQSNTQTSCFSIYPLSVAHHATPTRKLQVHSGLAVVGAHIQERPGDQQSKAHHHDGSAGRLGQSSGHCYLHDDQHDQQHEEEVVGIEAAPEIVESASHMAVALCKNIKEKNRLL